MWIVRSGAATPEQIDEIVTNSLGPRWAADGPFASAAMGGGHGGFARFLDHFAHGLQLLWLHSRIRPVILWPWFQKSLIKQVTRGLGARPIAELETARDAKLRAVLASLKTTRTEGTA